MLSDSRAAGRTGRPGGREAGALAGRPCRQRDCMPCDHDNASKIHISIIQQTSKIHICYISKIHI